MIKCRDNVFFFQAEDGIRDGTVTGVQTCALPITKKETLLPKLPAGVMGSLRWHKNGHELGFSLSNARGPGDVYSLDVATGKVERWTASETAVKTDGFPEAELVRWKSFDGKMISGFLYKPPAKFSNKRPVLVVIHGGPEGQS